MRRFAAELGPAVAGVDLDRLVWERTTGAATAHARHGDPDDLVSLLPSRLAAADPSTARAQLRIPVGTCTDGMDQTHPGTRGTTVTGPVKERPMGVGDKAKNAAEAAKGKAKEMTGDATDNRDLQAEGQAKKTKADMKQAGEKVKDAFKK
jgi:uncharacterized protein YjbJ (UPF0337 family)